jgi:hypothetical protein
LDTTRENGEKDMGWIPAIPLYPFCSPNCGFLGLDGLVSDLWGQKMKGRARYADKGQLISS